LKRKHIIHLSESPGNSDSIQYATIIMAEITEKVSPFGPNGDFHGLRYSRFAVGGLQLHLEMPCP